MAGHAVADAREVGAALQLRGGGSYRYADDQDAAAAGLAVRCKACGQFVGTAHSCPSEEATRLQGPLGVLRAADGTVLGRLTDPALVADALDANEAHEAVRVQVLLRITGGYAWPVSPAADPLAVADAGSGTVRGVTVSGTVVRNARPSSTRPKGSLTRTDIGPIWNWPRMSDRTW